MRRSFRLTSLTFAALLLVGVSQARAETPAADPLRLVPKEADVFGRIDHPRQAAEALLSLEPVQKLSALKAVREYYDSTNYRRVLQLVAYFEKELGAKWPELIDRLAGGGAVVAGKFGDKAPVLVVVQGKDAALTQKFFATALALAEQELARQDSKEKPTREKYRGVEIIRFGKDVHAAAAGTALIASNKPKILQAALDLHFDGDKNSLLHNKTVADAKKLLPKDPLAWLWLNFEPVHKTEQAKEVFALPKNDTNLTVLFGGWLEVARRSSFLAAGFHRQGDSLLTTVRLPSGREGMSEALAAHLPPADAVGSLPLLEPKGVVFSTSYFLDVAQFWHQRKKLLNAEQVKNLEDFDKQSLKFLLGNRFSKIIAQAGMHQRVVITRPPEGLYKTEPSQRLPSFAVVLEMREEGFGKTLESILRAAGLIVSTQVKFKMVEEKEGDVTLVTYRFAENQPAFKGDTSLLNYSPCFARVGDQFIAASTVDLGRDLVGLIKKEMAAGKKTGSPASVRSRVYGAGGAAYLQTIEDQLLTQTILDQASSPESARQQVRAFIDWVRNLGALETDVQYGQRDFRYDVRLNLSK